MPYSSGVAGKPYMGPIGGGGWQVGPHVLDPPGAKGNKPVDATAARPSTDKFVKPKPTNSNIPKVVKGVNGTRMAGLFSSGPMSFLANTLGLKGPGLYFNIATNLTGSSDRTTQWKRLGYKSKDDYDQAMRKYEIDTGKSSATGKPLTQEQLAALKGPSTEDLESIYHHPDLPGPTSNRVGSDVDTSTPGLQGSGAVPEMKGMSTADQQMFQWARNFKGLAEKVKPGQAGYAVIQQALGKAPTEIKDVDFSSEDSALFGMPESEQKIRESGGFTEWSTDMGLDAPAKQEMSAQQFLKDRINSGFYAASSEQQPNFDGTSQPIGGNSPEDPLQTQDFDNANTNPAEVVATPLHPLNKQPSPETEAANTEYGAMKFRFDPVKNMMVRVK